MLLAGPAVGGELVGPGTDYLAAAYAAGLREAVDVLDLHPYGRFRRRCRAGASSARRRGCWPVWLPAGSCCVG